MVYIIIISLSLNICHLDSQFIFEEIIRQEGRIVPKIIRSGTKFYSIKVRDGKRCTPTYFKDDLNFIPVSLEKFPKTFGIVDESKPFFPYLFNTRENIRKDRILPHLPPKKDYFYGAMFPEKRKRFDEWYEQNYHQEFHLRKELASYCMSDVRLLMEGLVAYRRHWKQECGFEVLKRCTTLASGVMMHYQMNCMPPFTIGIANDLSYEDHSRQSMIARKYIKWIEAEVLKMPIQHVDSPEGEKELKYPTVPDQPTDKFYQKAKVDGYVELGEGRTLVIEVNG